MTMEPRFALRIKNLSYHYRSDWAVKRFLALDRLSLDVFEGEAFGFLGHNGAGKTTTIKCILGLVRPSSGNVEIFGHDNRDPAARAGVGYIPEQPYFYDHLTVTEIMTMYAALVGVPRRDTPQRVAEALETVKLTSKAGSRMRSLSKGLTQRLALAQAIIGKPRLLILDEPFSGLDPIGRKEFRDIFLSLKKDGATIFMCSHILSDVEFLCDRVSIMARGKLQGVFDLAKGPHLSTGTYEMIVREHDARSLAQLSAIAAKVEDQERFARVTFSSRDAAMEGLRKAIDTGLFVDSYHFTHESLEDIFVRLVAVEESQGK